MARQTHVKICGLRNAQVADQIAKGTIYPDYVGFVFAASRRQVMIEQVQELALRLATTGIRKVGVFVNAPYQELVNITRQCQLDVLQLHGTETPELCKEFKRELQSHEVSIWKSCSVGDNQEIGNGFAQILNYRDAIDGILLDTYDPNQAGGTGKVFDWSRIKQVREYTAAVGMESKLIVAGGVHEQNVSTLINEYHPDCIDVSSGIETDDGLQDYEKIKSLIEKVKGI